MNIKIERLNEIRDELEDLKDDEMIFVDDEDESRFVILPIAAFEGIEQVAEMISHPMKMSPSVSIIGAKALELSYDEYEQVKEQILEAFDKTFKPKPDKLS